MILINWLKNIADSLQAAKDYCDSAISAAIEAVGALMLLKGNWDASAGTFPGSALQKAGWSWIVSVGGTVDGVTFNANDRLIAIIDNASTTVFTGNWFKADYTDQVLSVNTRVGAVSGLMEAADFTATAIRALLGISTLSGSNTGDSATPAETTTTIGTLINGATAKTTPVDADYVGLMDSAASNVLKKVSWANIKATLKSYFDTLYHSITPTYLSITVMVSTLGGYSLPTNRRIGDLMLIIVPIDASVTVTTPSGWVELIHNVGSGESQGIYVFAKPVGVEPDIFTLTTSSAVVYSIVLLKGMSGRYLAGTVTESNTTTVTGASIAPPVAEGILLFLANFKNTTCSTPTGFTLRSNVAGDNSYHISTKVNTSASATGDVVGTLGASALGAGVLLWLG